MLKLSSRTHISKLVFSPDSRALFAIGGQGTAVSVWDLQAGKLDQKIFMPPSAPNVGRKVTELAFCQPDKLILGGPYGSYPLRIWDWPTQPDATPREFTTERYRITMTSVVKGSRVLMTHYDSICLWNPLTDEVHRRYPTNYTWYYPIDINNDMTLLGYVSSNFIYVQKIKDRVTFQFEENGNRNSLFSHSGNLIHFQPSENRIAVAYQTGVRVFDCETLEPIGPELPLTKPAKALEFTPDGNQMIVATDEGFVQIWNANSFEQIASYDFGVKSIKCLAVAPDGLTCAIGGRFQEIVVIDLES